MLNDAAGIENVYIACVYTDLRYGIDGLATLVKNKFELNPFRQILFSFFCGRKRDRIKGLLWGNDGFLLLYKRLESGNILSKAKFAPCHCY